MYGKLFASMYDGTLATKGPWEALVTLQQMVVLCDRHGILDMTPEALARRTTIPLPIIQKGIRALEKADPDSRTPDEEGRRIIRLSDTRDWGWRLVNHEIYRRLRSEDDRREYMRTYQRDRRVEEKKGRPVNDSKHRKHRVNNVTHAVSSKHEALSIKQEAINNGKKASPLPSLGIEVFGDPAKELVEYWNAKARTCGYAVVAGVKGKRATTLGARLREPGWLEAAKRAIMYLASDDWYNDHPTAARFDVLIRPGKVEEYTERATMPAQRSGLTDKQRRTRAALGEFLAEHGDANGDG